MNYSKDLLFTPVAAGVVAAAASKFILKNDSTVQLLGQSMDKNIALGLVTAAGSWVGDASSDLVIANIPGVDAASKQFFEKATPPALAGAATWGLEKFLMSEASGWSGTRPANPGMNDFLLGAGSYMAGQYVTSMWKGI